MSPETKTETVGTTATPAQPRPAQPWSQTPEFILLALVLAIAAALLAFVQLAGEVVEGDTGGFDRALLLALRTPGDPALPLGPAWLLLAARDITSLGGYAVLTLVTLIVTGLLLIDRRRGSALLVVAAVGGGMLLSYTLKDYFDRPRPDLVPHAVAVATASFPSGHAMLSAVTYLTLGALLARVQRRRRVKAYLLSVAVLLTLLIGASRVFLGVHWPTDVLAGWCAGAGWAMLCWTAALWLARRGKVDATPAEGGTTGGEGAATR